MMSVPINIMHGALTIDANGLHTVCPADIALWLSQRNWYTVNGDRYAHFNYPNGMFWHEAVAVEYVNFMRIGHD